MHTIIHQNGADMSEIMNTLINLHKVSSYLIFFPGLSSWGRRVGRRLRSADSEDRLEYAVNPSADGSLGEGSSGDLHCMEEAEKQPAEPPAAEILRSVTDLRRKVSRVESLRRLILGASHMDSRRLFDKKKYRFRRASVGKVDKSIGTDFDLMGLSEDDLFDRTSSRFNASCESFDLDSVSQLSLAETPTPADGKGGSSVSGNSSSSPLKSISIDNIPHEVSAYHRTALSHAFLRSRLASLPEEHPGAVSSSTLKRRPNKEDRRPRSGSLVMALTKEEEEDEDGGQLQLSLTGPQSLGSDIPRPGGRSSGASGALSRKRSQSMADIIQRVALSAEPPEHLHQETGLPGMINRHKKFSKTRSEESGYDSDTTRKSGSSPRGSVKSDSFDPSETESSTCESHLKSDIILADMATSTLGLMSSDYAAATLPGPPPPLTSAATVPEVVKPRMKKPPRKSKEELRRVEISCQTDIGDKAVIGLGRRAPDVMLESSEVLGRPASSSMLPLNFADNIPTTLPSLTSKSFKMVRLYKGPTDELGIIISKKRNPNKGTTGYIIAHIEPDGLVNRYRECVHCTLRLVFSIIDVVMIVFFLLHNCLQSVGNFLIDFLIMVCYFNF